MQINNQQKEKLASELVIANKPFAFQNKPDCYAVEMESVAGDLTLQDDTSHAEVEWEWPKYGQ